MNKKKYTHLFFDLDNTLWDFEENSRGAMKQTFSHFHLDAHVRFDRFFDVYTHNNTQLWDDYRKGNLIQNELTRLRFLQTLSAFGIEGVCPDEMNAIYLARMAEQEQLVSGAREVLDYLKLKGYHLFIVTNGFSEVQHKKMDVTGLSHYFSRVFISEEVKAPKPSREIFDYAIMSANARKKSSLMIGDDLDVDVAGALHAGIDAVWYQPALQDHNRTAELKPKTGQSVYPIQSLKELKALL